MKVARRRSRGRHVTAVRLAAAAASACAVFGAAPDSALGTAYTWEEAVNGVWSDVTKWTPNTAAPTLPDDTAALIATGAAYTVTLDADQTIGSLLVDSPDARLALDGHALTLTGGTTTLSRGTIQLDPLANLFQSGGTFRLAGGAVSGGKVTLQNSATLQLDGGGAGGFVFVDSGTIAGPAGSAAAGPVVIPAAVNVTVRGDATGSVVSSVGTTGTLTNFGGIVLDSVGAASGSTLSVSGSLHNYGTIASNAGAGGARRIAGGSLSNFASVAVNTDTNFDLNVNNNGTFTIAPGTSAIMAPGRNFTQTAGALNIPAGTPFNMTGGTFALNGGTVNGTVNLPSSTSLLFGGGSGGNFVIQGSTSLMPGLQSPAISIPATTTLTVRGSTAGGGASLWVSNTLTNDGTIVLDSAGAVSGATFTFSGTTFANNGTISSNVGSGGTRHMGGGTLTNYGAVNINANTTVDASITNYGTFSIAPGRTPTFTSGRTFTQQAGLLSIPSDVPLTLNNSTFALNGGTVVGTVNLAGTAGLLLNGGGGGNYVIQDSTALSSSPSSINTTIPADVTLTVRGDQSGTIGSTLTMSGSTLTNNGAIVLDSVGTSPVAGPGSSTFNFFSSTMANYGTISSNVGAGGSRRISGGALNNYGAIHINTNTSVDAWVNNYGTFTIAPGVSALVGQSRGFTQSAGLLKIAADTPLNLNSGTFALNGGTVSGTVNLNGTWLHLNGGSGGNFVFLGSGNLSTAPSAGPVTVPASTSITVRGGVTSPGATTTLAVSGTLTNNGSIVLDSLNNAAGSTLTHQGSTLTNNGTITSNPGAGGSRRIAGGLVLANYGAVNINTDTNVDLSVNNRGTFTIAPGTSAILGSGRSFTQAAGALNIPAETPLNLTGGTFALNGGTVSGTVNLQGAAVLQLGGGSGGNYVVLDPATLLGSSPAPSTSVVVRPDVTVTVRGDSPAGGTDTVLNVPGSITNAGTISLDSAGVVAASTLSVTGATFTNYGTLNSNVGSGGARVVAANALNNHGTIDVNQQKNFDADVMNAGVLNLNAPATFRSLTGSGTMTGSGDKVFTGSSTLAAIATGNGQTLVESTGSLTVGNLKDATVTVNGELTIAPSGGASGASRVQTLNIGATGKVNLTDNKLVITGDATVADVEAKVIAGRNGGTWDGAGGIVTSMSDAASGLTTIGVAVADGTPHAGGTFGGVSLAPGDVIAMYTYAGDANLDGAITGDDYSAIDFAILFAGSNGYANGDFNYDGVITGDDYSVIDLNILLQGPQIPTGDAVASASSAGLAGVTAVPEPSACGFALLAAAGMLTRRRRTN